MNIWTWGLDIALTHVEVCMLAEGYPDEHHSIEVTEDGPDLSARLLLLEDALRHELPLFAQDMPPFSVWIEQPIAAGKHNVSLLAAYGVILSSLRRTLKGTTPYPVTIFPVGAMTVRKQVVGKGNAQKPDVQNAMIDINPSMRYKSVDAAEAMATAIYGVEMTGSQIR